jgi:23S rRNA pseudouridine1911/1915/1917 synthase
MKPSELNVLFEDKYLLALNKPQGLVSEREPSLKYTLESLALEYLHSQTKYPEKCYIGLPHRLDRPVSGVVLLAKKKSTLQSLVNTFAKREIEKTYLAVTSNHAVKEEDELVNWLVKDAERRKAIIHSHEVKNSMRVVLQYKLICQNSRGSLLQIKLITGKFHQIRAQLAYVGCPIIGDIHYGGSNTYKENAICLHARSLGLLHPFTDENLKIIADAPKDEIWDSFQPVPQ